MIYSIIGIVAIIINLIINRDVLKRIEHSPETGAQKAYQLFNYGILAYHITDVLWGICDASGSQVLLYADTVLYFIAMYLAVLFWARYVVKYIDDHGTFGKVLLIVAYGLLALELIVLIINHFVHIFFWVDASGAYHAYAFRYIAFVIQIVLFLTTSWHAFTRQKRAEAQAVKNRYKMIGAFGIAMSAAVIVQFFYPLLPFYSIGYMIGTCLIHSFIIEDENAELRRKADEANQAKTSFLFSMSHDIRTPMNAILGYTDIGLRHMKDPDTVKDSLEKIKASGAHLLQLINDILEMSRIESGVLTLAETPMDLRETIKSVVQISQALALPKSIDFRAKIGEFKNPYILADELHGNEVLINLLSNAVKFTNEGGKIEYTAEQVSEAVDGVAAYRFTVKDNGIGMSEEFQKHMFENFSRENTATVSRQEGTGLGLSIVKRIIDMAGGTIRVESAQGVGSTFIIDVSFRVMDEDAEKKFKAEQAEHTQITIRTSFDGRKVLLAEDNALNREIATVILEESGLTVETAEDGAVAVRMIREKGPDYYDFILMDIQMPVMDGYSATKAIREMPEGDKVKIIALSANAFEEDKQKSYSAGMNAHVAKPINMEELFEVISNLL